MFARIKKEKPQVLSKLIPVFGDVSAYNFGLSDDHLEKVLKETNVIFHMAANLKMKDDLKDAIEMNLMGIQYLINMGKQMPNLVSFVHLSTAFCNIDHEVMEEKVYDYPHNPKDLIHCAEWMDEKLMTSMIKPLIGHPENIYVYTKRLAEILVRDEFPSLPLCIARPSIVTPAFKEPLVGWVDNINGPMGFLVGCAKGVIRTAHINPSYSAEFIPVDMASNSLITLAAFNGSTIEK
jgi:fatty acyl-CoA reductase